MERSHIFDSAPARRGRADTDRIVDWLVSGLEPRASVFHVGQYCGSNWRASTEGRARASFHLVLRGRCWLHRQGVEPVRLDERDAVFLLRDLPHALTPAPAARMSYAPRPMRPLKPALADGTGLACGFFDLSGPPSELLIAALPACLLLRANSPVHRTVAPLFDLMLAEAERDAEAASPLIERLTELLFFYVVREVARRETLEPGLWALWRNPRFSGLIERLLREPGRDWTAEEMARVVNMSRATFFKRFLAACGQPPAQFLLALRMRIAAMRLRGGDSVLRAAEHVGYRSQAAFTRAFTKVIGVQPGVYQRSRRRPRARAADGWMHAGSAS